MSIRSSCLSGAETICQRLAGGCPAGRSGRYRGAAAYPSTKTATREGKKGRPECPTATQVCSLARSHSTACCTGTLLPSSLSLPPFLPFAFLASQSARPPVRPPAFSRGIRTPRRRRRNRRRRRRTARYGGRACVRRLIARALGFALVSSLQAEARTT